SEFEPSAQGRVQRVLKDLEGTTIVTSVANESPLESEPALHDTISIAEALADMQRLITLDAAWTAAGGDIRTARDSQVLIALGRQIDDQIAVVERHAFKMQRIFTTHRSWVNGRILAELNATDAPHVAQRKDARMFLRATDDDFAKRGAEVFEYVAKRAPVEREDLRRKIAALESAGQGETDMSEEFACGVLSGMVATGLLSCFKTVGTGCLVAGMAAGAGLALCK
ncbi:hypothetical protein, partial [Streptomyces sp. TLI_55]|uniref:hypothetical protein n=1 Tax=Streptomyces sp. TLI_55 TaxID=1938861 RepID=UPI001C53663C